jgi:dTDP-4-amino-4,6-dideoxygalactose transaminase
MITDDFDRTEPEKNEGANGMQVPLLDLKPQYQALKNEIAEVVNDIFESQHFILGPHVKRLEQAIAEYCGAAHAIGVSSGSDALLISLMAAGIGPGDRVLTSPYTFFATAGSIARLGAKPVFVDIEPDTYNLSSRSLENILQGMSRDQRSQIRAVIPVHLYGQCAEMTPLCRLARENGWVVIEDAAQAIGAEYQGRRAGSMGDFGCFSFFPSKNLGAFGDGGMVTTQNPEAAETLVYLRNHGAHPKYHHRLIGGNFRLDALQAAIGGIKLPYLDQWIRKRQANARRYRTLFAEAGLDDHLRLPVEKQSRHVYNQFVIQVDGRRDELRQHLTQAGVGHEVYYPLPLHLQECFASLGYRKGDFPVAETAARRTLALPIYPELTESRQRYVVETINAFYQATS